MADAFDQDLSHAYAPPSQAASSDPFDQDLTHAYSGGEASAPSSSQGAEWSDYYKSGKKAVQEMAARAMTGAQRFADAYGTQAASEANRRSAVDLAHDAEATWQSMSEGGRQIAEAQAIPTNGGPGLIESAWNHPVDTIGVKGAQVIGGVAPYLVAGAVGGLPAEVAVGAVDQASSSMQAAVGQSNAMTDAELAQASPRFAQLLRETPDPYAARVKFRDELYTTPQLAADLVGGGAIGWITGRTLGSGKAALSGAEKVAEVGGGAAERSALRTMTEQGVGNAAGAVSTDYAQQRSEAVSKGQAAGFTPNVGQMLVAGVNAGVEGALAAGAPHAYAGARDRVKTWLGSEPRPPVPVVPEVGGDAAQNAALQATQQGVTPPIQPTQRQPAPRAPAAQGEISPSAPPVTPAANPAPAAAQQQAIDAAAARLNAGPVDAGNTSGIRSRLEPIPFDEFGYSEDGKPTSIPRGEAPIVKVYGRPTVTVNVDGVRVPFYVSTGSGGKASVQPGKWYPFFGWGRADGWFNKTSEAEINNYYGSPKLKAIAKQLDAEIGDVRRDTSIPEAGGAGRHVDHVNRDLSPFDREKSGSQEYTDYVRNVVAKIEGIKGSEAPAGPVDAGMNVPERPETLAAQEQAQAEGRKDVVAYPGGKGVPKLDPGMARVDVGGIAYVYRQKNKDAPDGLTAKQIRAAHADGSIAGLLNPAHAVQPKSEVAARVAQGEPAAAVVTQKPDGTEVEASASTPDMVPAKMAAMEATKAPDETVVVKPVDQVVAERERPTFAEALAEHPDSWAIPARDEDGYDNPEYLHLRNIYASHPELDMEGALKLLDDEQRKMTEKSGVAGYPDPRTYEFLDEKDIAEMEADYENRRAAEAKDVTPRQTTSNEPVTSTAKTPERPVPEGASRKAAEDLGAVAEKPAAAPEVEPGLPKIEINRTTRAQDVLDAAKGVVSAPAVAPRPKRRAKPPEEQKQGNAGPHERRARSDANRLGAEIAARYKIDDDTIEAAGRAVAALEAADRAPKTAGKKTPVEMSASDRAAMDKVVAIARKMIADFHAEAKKINEAHNSTRQGAAPATLSKEQVKIPGQYARNIDPARAPSAGLAMLMEARSLSNNPKKFLQQFLTRHTAAHKGDLTTFNENIYADRRAAGEEFGDSEKARAASAAAKKAGVEDGATPDLRDMDSDTAMESAAAARVLEENIDAGYDGATDDILKAFDNGGLSLEYFEKAVKNKLLDYKTDEAQAVIEGVVNGTAKSKQIQDAFKNDHIGRGVFDLARERGLVKDEDLKAPKIKAPPPEPPKNTVVKESLAAEREKQIGEERKVSKSDFERIAREAQERADEKEAAAPPPPPKPKEPAPKPAKDIADEWLEQHDKAGKPPPPKPKEPAPKPAKDIADEWLEQHDKAGKPPPSKPELVEDADMAAVWTRQRGENVADEPLPIRSLDAGLTGTVQEQLDHVMSGGTFARLPSGRSVAVTRTAKARSLIKPSDFGRMWTSDPKDRVFMPMVIRRMLQVAGDTPVSILKDSEMNRRAMENWTKADAMGAYDPRSDRVYMLEANGEVARHVLVHEVTHAATAAGIESSPKLKADIRKLMNHVLDQVGDQGWFERPGLNDIKTIRDHYAFKNEKEFIAEFGGNKIFRETIRDVQVSPELARELGMKNWQRQTVYNAIIDRLRRFFRLPEKAHSALEAALMLTDRAMTETERARNEGRARTGEALPLPRVDDARRAAEDMRLGERMREQAGRLKRYMAFTNDIARKLDELMGEGVRWARDVASMLESKHARFNRFLKVYGGEDAVATASRLQREHGEDYRRLVDLTYDARHAGVDIERGPEQFSDAINSVKGKAWLEKHGAEIARLRDEQPELWSGMKQVRDTVDRYHTESAVGALKSVLEYFKMEGVDTEGLARRFYHDALTDRDKALLDITDETKAEQKEISELLNAMHGLRVKYRKEAGTYTPFFREGTHWISAKRAVNYVGSGELTSANEVHFEQQEGETKAQLRERVKDFARTAVKEHDYDLGDIYSGVLDPENPHGALLEPEQEGPLVYRVPLKLDYAAKVDGEVTGRQHLEELKADNTYRVGDRTYYRYEGFTAPRVQSSSDFTSPGSGALSPRLDALRARLQKQDAFKMKDPAEQEAILRTLEEAALIGRAGTSSLSPNLLRARKVRGYDTDYTRAVASYISRAASDMAKAEVMPQVEDALYKINQQIGYRKDDTQGHTDRAAYYEEFKNRLLHSTEMSKTAKNPVVRRLLQMTALDKLFGVSFHVVNATEAPILSGAALGGRHGFTRTYANMGAIYRMMGVGDLLKSGAKNTWGARDVYARASDYPGMVREALSRTEEGRALIPALDHMVDRGLMSPEAEYFFHQESAPKESGIGKAMSTADRMARQMTQVVETINRTVTGLAAYKMERARLIAEGKTEAVAQKAALDYAHDTVKEVMGDYSNTNSGRIFDEQYLGAAMQFKKYAVKTYTLMGRMVGNAWKGDKEAQRSFLGLMVLQGVAAGAMGLPFMEVAKQAYSAYNFAAGNEYDVDAAFEYGLRSLAKTLGFTGAAQDAAVHGVTRAIPGVGIDLGSRVGMDKLTGVTLPKSTRKNDMLEWFGATLTGVSESTIQELLDGLGKLRDDALKGPTKATDVVAHVGNVLPIKAAADVTKAAAGYFGQPETARGYKRSDPYTPAEAVLKAMGLRSAREARESELRNVDYVQTQIQQHQRTDFERRWNLATTGDERARLWGEIERWNAGIADPTARLRRADLNAYVADFKKKSKETVLGQEVHKRDRWIVNRNKQLFGAP